MGVFVKDAGVWKESGSGGLSVKDANAWKTVDSGFVKDANVWKQFYQNVVYLVSRTTSTDPDVDNISAFNGAISYTPSQDIYITSQDNQNILLQKYNVNGSPQLARKFSNGSFDQYKGSIADSSGNTYVFTGNGEIVKINSSGTQQWRFSYSFSFPGAIGFDNSGNLLACSFRIDKAMLIRVDPSNGSVLLARTLSGFRTATDIKADSSGNVYIVGADSGDRACVAKFNSSFAKIWAIRNNSSGVFSCLSLDSSGNIYIGGRVRPSSDYPALYKYNNSGTFQWGRQINQAGGSGEAQSISIDASNNVYVTIDPGFIGYVFKFDSSGNVLWQRSVDPANAAQRWENGSKCLQTEGSSTLYLYGHGVRLASPFTSLDTFTLKLPQDGSKTGTYNGVAWAASSISVVSFTPSDATLSESPGATGSTPVNIGGSTTAVTTSTTTVLIP
ncbi:MAG: hypothetical protein ACO3HP_05425 [Candidatus Nanopelagicaceae bacterium]